MPSSGDRAAPRASMRARASASVYLEALATAEPGADGVVALRGGRLAGRSRRRGTPERDVSVPEVRDPPSEHRITIPGIARFHGEGLQLAEQHLVARACLGGRLDIEARVVAGGVVGDPGELRLAGGFGWIGRLRRHRGGRDEQQQDQSTHLASPGGDHGKSGRR
jgi:hypothetical protein